MVGMSWFPGHMVRARREIRENLKLVDVVVEVIDARAPRSTRNLELESILKGKPLLLVLNKADLVEPKDSKAWVKTLGKEGLKAVAVDSLSRRGVKEALSLVRSLYQSKACAMLEKGRRIRPARAMIVGVSNVGKSTFLNAAVGRKVARTGANPGITRGKQWVMAREDIEFLDTPGLLWPRIDNREQALKLAILGILGEKTYDAKEAAFYLLSLIKARGLSIQDMDTEIEPSAFLNLLAKKKGWFAGENPDEERAAWHLLKSFRRGDLGKVVLDEL